MKAEVELEPPEPQRYPSDSDPLLESRGDSSLGRSSEIKVADVDNDVEAGSIPCCRICLESDCEPG